MALTQLCPAPEWIGQLFVGQSDTRNMVQREIDVQRRPPVPSGDLARRKRRKLLLIDRSSERRLIYSLIAEWVSRQISGTRHSCESRYPFIDHGSQTNQGQDLNQPLGGLMTYPHPLTELRTNGMGMECRPIPGISSTVEHFADKSSWIPAFAGKTGYIASSSPQNCSS